MEQPKIPNSLSGSISIGKPGDNTLLHNSPDEIIQLNKYHLLWVLERLQQHQRGPKLEHVMIPFVLLLGTLLTLLPADYKNYLGLEPAVWESIAIIIVILSTISTIFLFIWWCMCKIKFKHPEPLDTLNEIIKQMSEDRQKLHDINKEHLTDNKEI